jgi:hypothetical protein
MFAIKGVQSGKALNVASDLRIVMWTYSGTDNQLWYWDKDSIRSKEYPEKVLNLNIANFDSYGWTKVSLQTYDGGNNQIWNIDGVIPVLIPAFIPVVATTAVPPDATVAASITKPIEADTALSSAILVHPAEACPIDENKSHTDETRGIH